MRDGQEVTIYDGAVTTLNGKRGTLTIRDRNQWVAVESGRGRRRHQHLEGGARDRRSTPGSSGRAGVAMQASVTRGWYARYEGFLTLP